ncbi:hypothetical protein [Nocardiopsis salina]|uniref:hypothetical protein n=1 Tax=Nocardiopsis salina TaxID=245836 RepID=UPI0018732A94|nr:hypothetical protein [Nocardiopsis salina]
MANKSWPTDAVAALALLGVPLLHTAGLLSFPVLLVLVLLVGLSTGPAEAAGCRGWRGSSPPC